MQNLRKLREAQKMSQHKLSRISNIPQPMISDIENGKTKSPTVDTAVRLANALGCSVEDLMNHSEKAV